MEREPAIEGRVRVKVRVRVRVRARAAPPWSASLPSKVQLALLVLRERERERGPWAPFLLAWPSDAPALPESLDDTTLAREAQVPA